MTRRFQRHKVWQAPIEGLNLSDPPELVTLTQATDLVNVYHEGGFLKKALGYAKNTTIALTKGGDTIIIGKIYDFINDAGTSTKVAEGIREGASARRYVLEHDGTDWVSISTTKADLSTFDADEDINFATFGDRLIICNGQDRNTVWTGTGGEAYFLGINPPTNTLVDPGEIAGAIPDATYFYTYTYKSTATGFESNPRAITAGFSVAYTLGGAQRVWASPADTSVTGEDADKWELYRTVAGGAAAGPYFSVGDADVGVAITDNVLDSALGPQLELDHDVAPDCQIPHVWRNRLWLTGDPSNKSTTYYSRVGTAAYFPGVGSPAGDAFGPVNLENVDASDGEVNTGLGDMGNILVMTKERSIHLYVHGGGDKFPKMATIRRHGCLNHRSIVQKDGLWMADQNGIWFFDGQASFKVSTRIDSIFDDMSASGKTKFHAVWYEPLSFYVLFYQRSGSTLTDAAIIIDSRNRRPQADRVGIFKMEPLKCNGSGLVTDDDGEPNVWTGHDEGHGYLFFKPNTYSFDTAAYKAFFKSAIVQLDPNILFRFREAIMTVRTTGSWQVGLDWNLDFGNRVGGSTNVDISAVSMDATWIFAGSSVTWTFAAVGVSWALTTLAIIDATAEIEGESKSIQFTVSNDNANENFDISKMGLRAQVKKVA